jgi:hypothetical protein
MSDQPVAEASTYTGQHNRQTFMPRGGFEPATPATKRPQTYALDRAASGIGIGNIFLHYTEIMSSMAELMETAARTGLDTGNCSYRRSC